MKRDGYLIEEIIEQANLEASFDEVVSGEERKSSTEGKWLLAHRDDFLSSVRGEILSGKISLFPVHRAPTKIELENGGCVPKEVKEGGKVRRIQVFCMAARIKVNAIMRIVDKHLKKRYIRTTSASIKGRGMHDLKAYIEDDLRHGDGKITYWYKFDIRKFYDTVVQDFAMYALDHVFKDKLFLLLMEQLVRLLPGGLGMSMGLRASQGVCNLLLSAFLDHYVKDILMVLFFYRYCDDGVNGSNSKRYLWMLRNEVHECINSIGQEIKNNECIFPVKEGLDFLGYVIYPSHTILRKRVKQNFARKLKRIKSRKRRRELIGSLWGLAKHCKSWHLLETLLYPSELNKLKKKRMKSFAELGISYKPADEKKRFPNKATQLRKLVNVKIEILDFERDVKTKYGNRCLVMFRDTRTNETSKFFTDCDEMKQNLEAALEMNEIPFETVIDVEYFGDNGMKYKFT